MDYVQLEHRSQHRDRSRDEGDALDEVEDTLERLDRLGVTIRQLSRTSNDYLANTSVHEVDAGLSDDSIKYLFPKAHPSLKRLLRSSMSQRLGRMDSLNERKPESSSGQRRDQDIERAAALFTPDVSPGAAPQPSHQPLKQFSPVEDTDELPSTTRGSHQQISDTTSELDAQRSYESGLPMSNCSEHMSLTSKTPNLGRPHARGINSGLASIKHIEPQALPWVVDTNDDEDDDDDDDDEYLFEEVAMKNTSRIDSITHDLDGLRQLVYELNPGLAGEGRNYLADRIAHQQAIRFNYLLNLKLNHARQGVDCSSGPLCVARGGSANVLGRNGISVESLPPGIPMPCTQFLPAELECQLCYRKGLFWGPFDWTKHVHEDLKPFTCTWEKCKRSEPFGRKADWVRHENEGHRHLEWWTCDVEDCQHSCFRQDNFLQHLVREHKLPKPKGKEKKGSGDIDPTWKKVEGCHQETHLRPWQEPCKFCERTFSTWKNLITHLAEHMIQISLPVLLLVEAQSKEPEADLIRGPLQSRSTMCACCAKSLGKCEWEPERWR